MGSFRVSVEVLGSTQGVLGRPWGVWGLHERALRFGWEVLGFRQGSFGMSLGSLGIWGLHGEFWGIHGNLRCP